MANSVQQAQQSNIEKKWYKKIRYWILILICLFVSFVVFMEIITDGMPMINVPDETNQESLTINGHGAKEGWKVSVYNNDVEVFEIIANDSGEFSGEIILSDGENRIYAIADYKDKTKEGIEDVIVYTSLERLEQAEERKKKEKERQRAEKEEKAEEERSAKEEKIKMEEELPEIDEITPDNSNTDDSKEREVLSRSTIINAFPEFNIKKATSTSSGEENYTGKALENTNLQIIGNEDNVKTVSFMQTMDPSTVANVVKQEEYFNRLIDTLIPGKKVYELSWMQEHVGDTEYEVNESGYKITYSYISLGGGSYAETYTFRKIN